MTVDILELILSVAATALIVIFLIIHDSQQKLQRIQKEIDAALEALLRK